VIQNYDDKLQDPTSSGGGGGGVVTSISHVCTSAMLVLMMLVQGWVVSTRMIFTKIHQKIQILSKVAV
jgi:hypothetical protein